MFEKEHEGFEIGSFPALRWKIGRHFNRKIYSPSPNSLFHL